MSSASVYRLLQQDCPHLPHELSCTSSLRRHIANTHFIEMASVPEYFGREDDDLSPYLGAIGLVVRKWNRPIFDFLHNYYFCGPLLDSTFNNLKGAGMFSAPFTASSHGGIRPVPFPCVRRLICANIEILLISFLIVFQRNRRRPRSILQALITKFPVLFTPPTWSILPPRRCLLQQS